MLKNKIHKAFTLIELSIILAVISILLAGLVSVYSSKDKNIKTQESSDTVKIVYQALQKYLAANKSLPCPASLKSIKSISSDYGFAVTATNCVGVGVYQSNSVSTLVYGMVPTATLGLDNKFAEDAYGNKLVYVTDYRLTNSNDFESNINNSNLISISGGASVSNAIFVIMSRGSNSSGAFPANSATMTTSSVSSEQSNDISNFVDNTPPTASTANFSGNFVQSNSDSNFDDVILYKTKDEALSENTLGSKLIPCQSSDSTESLYGTFMTWPKAYEDQVVAAQTPCPSPNWNGSVIYPTKKCGTNGQWSSVINSCACSSGYSGADCTKPSNECTFSGITGVNDGTVVSIGSGTQLCNSGSYYGAINYTCSSSGGNLTINSGSCYLLCSGGNITHPSGTYDTVHTFTTSDTLTCPVTKTGRVLVVAGGGGGGAGSSRSGGAGGGGGGVIYNSNFSISTSTTVTVGNGGAGAVGPYGQSGTNGSNSSFGSTLVAVGGGGGGGSDVATGKNGGSGGGSKKTIGDGATGVSGQGNSGGIGSGSGQSYGRGGGGGAGGVGGNGSGTYGGSGGIGIQYDISGTSTYYAGGGGGSLSTYNNPYCPSVTTGNCPGFGAGGLGGGGTMGAAGTANTGGGGSSAINEFTVGGAGGSGIVIIRYSN